MELAASAFAAMTAAGTAAAGTVATAASGTLSTLSGAATALSMASTLLGGAAMYRQHQDAASAARFDARAEEQAAAAEALKIRRDYVKAIGQNRVAFAASGLDISSGAEIEDALGAQSDRAQEDALLAGRIGGAGRRAQAASYATRATSSLFAAAAKAGGQYIDYRIDLSKRG